MQLPKEGIFLAPANQHLLLMSALLEQHGHSMDVEIYPLETYIASLSGQDSAADIEILYQMKEMLSGLEADNAFYESRQDADFLKSVLSFLRLQRTWQIQDLPQTTRKDRDLKAILEKLSSLPLAEDAYARVRLSPVPFDHIYILRQEFSAAQSFWVDWLIDHGAHYLENTGENEKIYWSVANSRKAMEAVAREIIQADLDASQVMIALADQNERFVLEQILEAHHIPYSYISKPNESRVIPLWKAVLAYLLEPDAANADALMALADPQAQQIITAYHQVFPEGSRLFDLTYVPNTLISEEDFQSLKRLEDSYFLVQSQYEMISRWNAFSLEDAALFIQQAIPEPTEEDLQAFERIAASIAAIKDKIHSHADLQLLAQFLLSYSTKITSKELQGVVIGTRQDLSALRPIAFYAGVHAGNFPGYRLEHGIFDESYLARTTLPSLASRLEAQKASMFSALLQPEKLYIITPQSDYTGKSLENAPDLIAWTGAYPTFLPLWDQSFVRVPKFELKEGMQSALFTSPEGMQTSAGRMLAYAGCPLQHYLRFGLKLRRPRNHTAVYIPGSLFNTLLEKAHALYNKQYYELTYEDVKALTEQEFAFALQVFPHLSTFLQARIQEYAFKIHVLLQPLMLAANRYHFQLINKAAQASYTWQTPQGVASMSGQLNDMNGSQAGFMVENQDENGQPNIAGALVMDLKATSLDQSAMKVSYRKKTPEVLLTSDEKAREEFVQETFVKAWQEQNLDERYGGSGLDKVFKKPSFIDKEKEWKDTFDTYVQSLAQCQPDPVHKKDTCKHCPYTSICRNGAREASAQKKEEKPHAV